MDPRLSELGQLQAERVAERLSGEPWSALYTSDLRRASQTAERIARRTGLVPRVKTALRERSQGKREGLLAEDALARYPDANAPEVGRETYEALTARAVQAFESIRDAHIGERVVVVSHGALMAAFVRAIVDPDLRPRFANTSCTVLHWDGGRWSCESLGDASHLDDELEHDRPVRPAG